jgi:REase_DpnII-MboI
MRGYIEERKAAGRAPGGDLTDELYFHVLVHTANDPKVEVKFDMRKQELKERMLGPYEALRPLILNGRTILSRDLTRLQIFSSRRSAAKFDEWAQISARNGVADWYYGEDDLPEVSDEFIRTPSVASLPQKTDAVLLLCSRFHGVVRQLRQRHDSRPTIDVADEYDAQDLLHALLRVFFDDVRAEEWTGSYAGKASRIDFLIPLELLGVEVKMARKGLGAKELGDELIIDIARYKKHPDCRRLLCFVYDPDGRVLNPGGIERDLSGMKDGFEVQVMIAPRG